jgi:hypothetical protein
MLIEHGKNGFVFDPQNPASLAGVMSQCRQLSDEERKKIESLAMETIQTTFLSEKLIRQRIEYYAAASNECRGISGNSFLRSLVNLPEAGPRNTRTLRQKLASRAIAVLKKWE